MAGLATAVGNAAQGMAAMSGDAKLAAGAAGIGALLSAVGLLIALSIEAKKALTEIPKGALSDAASAHLKNLHTEQDAQSALAALAERRVALEAKLQNFGGAFGGQDALTNQKKTLQQIVDIDAQREALTRRSVEIREEDRKRDLAAVAIVAAAQTTAVGRYAAQLRQIDAERLEAIRTHELSEKAANQRAADQRHDLAKEGRDYTLQLSADAAVAELAADMLVYEGRRTAEQKRYEAEKRALEDRFLQTVDPYSPGKINEVSYLLDRAGVLKRPIQIPSTTGLQGAA
jgi:hypothetical protein